jgi:hypothetical protein
VDLLGSSFTFFLLSRLAVEFLAALCAFVLPRCACHVPSSRSGRVPRLHPDLIAPALVYRNDPASTIKTAGDGGPLL